MLMGNRATPLGELSHDVFGATSGPSRKILQGKSVTKRDRPNPLGGLRDQPLQATGALLVIAGGVDAIPKIAAQVGDEHVPVRQSFETTKVRGGLGVPACDAKVLGAFAE
jgi:hypothetical protein